MIHAQDDINIDERHPSPKRLRRLRVLFWDSAGTLFLAIGLVGVVLPILPTTPFLLLAAACYLKGSKRMHTWMTNNRWFGQYLRDYMEGKGIPRRTKVVSLSALWLVIVLSAVFATESLVIRVVLLIVAIGVTVHVTTIKTKPTKS
ncbi:MAG: YbaN family protein [Methanobacteriota archaeon]|nr:MAG: YbaN family protein [Euryarchaeota archaeon]